MTITEMTERHHAWLVKMGWTNANPLESLALIASEIGEAVNECRGAAPTPFLGSELADIILRTVGLAKCQDIDIEAEIQKKMDSNAAKGNFKQRKI